MGIRMKAQLIACMFALSAFTAPVRSETILCIGEAGALVEQGGPRGTQAGLVDAAKRRFLLTGEGELWKVREVGKDNSPMQCDSQYYCEVKGGFAALFTRNNQGSFMYIETVALDDDLKRIAAISIMGKCSKL